MRVIEPKVEVLAFDPTEMMKRIELIGRVCYKSEDMITADSADKRVRGWIEKGHEAMLEHAIISIKLTCDRGVTHEVVRHRLDSFAQESTRYCNYGTDKFAGQVTFIKPFFWDDDPAMMSLWEGSAAESEATYLQMINNGASPQEARDILINSLKTEIWWTANLREWRHIFSLRAAKPAHPQMRELMIPTLLFLTDQLPAVFDSVGYDTAFPSHHYANVEWIQV